MRSLIDRLLGVADNALRTLASDYPAGTGRASPGVGVTSPELSPSAQALSASLMRVNHSGEVAAQALYQGQALASKDESLVSILQRAAQEEADHLRWCQERIDALGGRRSLFNPIWYAGAFTLGYVAGRLGDRVSLGFLSETEKQVEAHLVTHRHALPGDDLASHAVIEQMIRDEANHGHTARQYGAVSLSVPIRTAMKLAGRVMTSTARHI